MYTYRIVATAPTVYQSRSLSYFNLNTKKTFGGSFVGTMDFYSEDDAKDYLISRAEMYFDDSEKGLREALKDIEVGYLTLDAVTAKIEEIEHDEEE